MDDIKVFLLEQFADRKSMKKKVFYKNVSTYYEKYPNLIIEILDNFPKLGYWKDFLLVLKYTDNQDLINYIYNLLVDQYKQDLANYKEKKNITTLAKWLPRQKSSFDVELNFVDNFNKILYPTYTTIRARVCYRKHISKMCKYLEVPEQYICSKEYEKINFSKVTDNFVTKYHEKLLTNVPDNLEAYVIQKFTNMNLWKFVRTITNRNKKFDDFYKKIIQEVWDCRKIYFLPELNQIIDLTNINKILVDISDNIYSTHMVLVTSILLVASEYNIDKKRIFVNAYNPIELENFNNQIKLFDRLNIINTNVMTYKNLMIEKIPDYKFSKILILTDKIKKEFDENIIYWQITKDKLIQTKNSLIGTPIPHRKSTTLIFIENLIKHSPELRYFNFARIIIFLLVCICFYFLFAL